jgi:RimJ/RimL family protein N-acetyltransferase
VAHSAPDAADFPVTVTAFWSNWFCDADARPTGDGLLVAVNPDLPDDRAVMVLRRSDGSSSAVLAPTMAGRIGLDESGAPSEAGLLRRLDDAGVRLHGADCLFYFTDAARASLLRDGPEPGVRRLSVRDSSLFAAFRSAASEQDLDDAYVELDHWAVFGAFDRGRLVCVASMYPWEGDALADLGVLTLQPARGRGHARRVVRAICRHAYELGYEPQYRCQVDNEPSIALARASGLTLFGTWQVISPDQGAA